MSVRRDADIEARQAAIGLKPVTGGEAELLSKMSDAAFELIKVIELERSGIRDGDGYWTGSDVMGYVTGNLATLIEQYLGYRTTRQGSSSTEMAEMPWG